MPEDFQDSAWRSVRLGDVCFINPDKIDTEWPHEKIEYIDISSVGTGVITTSPSQIPVSDAPSRAQRLVRPGDTILATVRPNLRSFAYLAETKPNTVVSTGFAVLRSTEESDRRFIYYVVSDQSFTDYLAARAEGSAYPAVSVAVIGDAELRLPPIEEQRSIGEVLGALDDKIEQNRRTARALERLARAIFRAWFVDFEPVKAKAAGGTSFPSMRQEVFDALPTRFVDSDIGSVPEGWEVSAFGELLELAYGKALKAGDRKSGSIPVYGSNGRVGWNEEALEPQPGIIVGRKGNPGTVEWSSTAFFPIDTTFFVRLKDDRTSLPLLYYQLVSADLKRLATDSAVPGINRNMIYAESCVIPNTDVRTAFDGLANACWELAASLDNESRMLADVRDYLLPRLLSGQVRVQVPNG